MLQVAPSAREIENLTADDEVTFAPMDALDDGLGGLDVSGTRPLGEVAAGSYNYFRDGDVLLAKVTPCFENGKKALARGLINGVGFATSEVHVFRPIPGKLDARFLMYLFSSEDFRAEGMKSMTGAGGLKRVSDATILNYRPEIVDIDLQRKVADFLDREMGVFEVIKKRTKASIDRLREYRAGLITAAVTGQIDVDTDGKSGTTSATLDQIEQEMQG
jgi:type I restriction enzyme, S subunit